MSPGKCVVQFMLRQYGFLGEAATTLQLKLLHSKWRHLSRRSLRIQAGVGLNDEDQKFRGIPKALICNDNLVKTSQRSLSSVTAPVLQRNSDNNNKDAESASGASGKGEGQVSDKNLDIKSFYNPKEDSFFTQDVAYGSKENKGNGEPERPVFIPPEEGVPAEEEDLSPPTNCCQSGCPNCVWIEYVEKLSKKYTDPAMSREKILQELDELDDQNIKAFIMMELRVRKLI